MRRIARRMQVNGIRSMADYLAFLRTQLGEAGALLQDMLISVTNFFRDRDAFQALQAEIPKLFEGKHSGDQVRAWVAGCATGEEAYSVAILLCEHAATLESPPSIQVFATDLDEHAIRIAREGAYPETIAADVTEERLRRYFFKEGGQYRVKREVREAVLFALHDLFKDSPFSRLDLVTCRNLLIYVNREMQGRAFEVFHFALKDEGRLFLGSSESGEEANTLFFAIDKKHRLYARRAVYRSGLPVPSGPASLSISFDPKLATKHTGASGTATLLSPRPHSHTGAASAPSPVGRHSLSWAELHFQLLEKIAPPSIIVDRDHNIVHLSARAGRYLEFVGGEPTMNLLNVVHPMLRIELRTALFRAQQSRQLVELRDVPLEIDGDRCVMHLRVQPALDLAPDYFLVVFEESKAIVGGHMTTRTPHDAAVVRQLEEELEQVKRQLRDTVEQYEASNEEMKASNEELQAMNEELRSASEELETSREELQSINEELSTVNQELKSKVEELSHANSDLQNLMASTNIATIFLDRQLCIKRYTPSAVALFNLIPTDIGRPLSDLTHRLEYNAIVIDAERVLEHLAPVEREVASNEGYFLARLLPYRTLDDRIDGVVLTFVDITQRKQSEESLRQSEERFRQLADAMPQLVWTADPNGTIDYYNKRLDVYAGATRDRDGRWIWTPMLHPEDVRAADNTWREAVARKDVYSHTHRIRMTEGNYRWHLSRAVPVRSANGEVVKWFGTATDIDDQKRAAELLEEKVRERTSKLQEVITELEAFSYSVSHDLRSPLRSMQGYAQALLEDCGPQLAPDHRDQLEKMARAASRLDKLTQDVLTYSRLPREDAKLSTVDLNRLVQDILEQYPKFQQPHAEVSVQSPLLPVHGHEAFLTQCISNLLGNAIKFVPEGITPRITIWTEARQNQVRLWIEDNGIGIAPEHRARIFQIFGRIHSDRAYEGSGIGLVLVKKAVERMGGQVDFDSQPGKGTRFWVQLLAPVEK